MKTKVFLITLVSSLFFLSCTEEYSTMADRIQISALMNGKVLNPGDTIIIDEFKTANSYIDVRYQIKGLQSGEQVEVFSKYGFSKESMVSVGETYTFFTQQKDSFWNSVSVTDFVNVFRSEEMFNTLKFKCSDGSEKWLNYPVKIVVDSSNYVPDISLTYSGQPSNSLTLPKGSGLYVSVWMNVKILEQSYLRVVSENYNLTGQWIGTGGLPGRKNEFKLDSGIEELLIPYESHISKRIVEFQLIGRYGKSDIQTITVNWE